jgi:hypothetical protein
MNLLIKHVIDTITGIKICEGGPNQAKHYVKASQEDTGN